VCVEVCVEVCGWLHRAKPVKASEHKTYTHSMKGGTAARWCVGCVGYTDDNTSLRSREEIGEWGGWGGNAVL
jgi:hypothetical protein